MPLMEKNDLFSVSIVEEETMTSHSPAEETGSLDEEPKLQEELPATVHAPDHMEEAVLLEEVESLGLMTIAQRWLPLAPPGFMELLVGKSGPPPQEDAGLPWGSQLDLSPLGLMQVVITQNASMGELWYHYQIMVISQTSLHLALSDYPDQPNPCWHLEGLLSK